MAQDPGREYLYAHPGVAPQSAHIHTGGRADTRTAPHDAALTMQPLARNPTQGSVAPVDWGACMGNLKTAQLAVEALQGLMADAVFLDEEAFTNAATLQLYQRRLQAQQRRLLALENEADALRQEVAAKDAALAEARAEAAHVRRHAQDLQAELDGNAAVFKMHYDELLLKNDEIQRLTAIIEGLAQ